MQNSPENDKYIRVAVIAGLAEISVLYLNGNRSPTRYFYLPFEENMLMKTTNQRNWRPN